MGLRRALATAARPLVEPWSSASTPLASASAPPPSWSVSPDVFAAEAELLFPRLWHPVAAAADLAAAGSVVGARVAGQPVLVARATGGLRAFVNSCAHAGALLAPLDNAGRPAQGDRVACPYHGWTYLLDSGRLASAPRMGGVDGFAARSAGLRAAGRAEAWGPLVFARLAGPDCPAPPPGDDASDDAGDDGGPVPAAVAAALAGTGVQDEGLSVVARHTFDVRANWKVVVANYCDGGYHVPVAHPALAAGLDLGRYERVVIGDTGSSLQTVPPAPHAPARLAATAAAYAYLWPFAFVNRYGGWLDVNLIHPVAVDHTRVTYVWLRDRGAPSVDHEELAADVDASRRVQEEDTALCESVQAGLGAAGAVGGRYAPRLEGPLFAFHRRVAAAYREVGMLV